MTTTPESSAGRFVSAGRLPRREAMQARVDAAHRRLQSVDDGRLSPVYPALARADPGAFALSVVSTGGEVITSGDARAPFTIMSVAKPFVFALACELRGIEEVRRRVGVNATGMSFNSGNAVERDPQGRTNPMVNPGAIATTSRPRSRRADQVGGGPGRALVVRRPLPRAG